MFLLKFQNKLLGISNRAIIKGKLNYSSKNNVIKEKFITIPSRIEISAIGHGFAGTPKCVIVKTTNCSYMFNCGEGTQRIGSEYKKIKGTNRVFFTNGKWENVGGLTGVSSALATAGTKKLYLYGTPQFDHYLDSLNSFSNFEKIELVKEDISKSFTDLSMTIDFIKINKNEEHIRDEGGSMKSPDCDAVAYLCKPCAKLRKIDLEKCIELNVPQGPHLELLMNEKEIILPGTDRVIKPDDVLFPKMPNDPFLSTNMVQYARTNTIYKHRPFTEYPFNEEYCLTLNPAKYLNEALNESAKTFMEKWQEKYRNLKRKEANPEDPEVVFLGTGSAVPNKYRNVSCIMLNVREDASIMMDCGENSCGQLYRLYGLEEGKKKLKNLKAVFVSHLHTDHYLGVVGLAIERKKCFEGDVEPLIVVGPEALSRWYSDITCDDIPINELITFIRAECLYSGDHEKPPTYKKLLDLFDFEKVQTVHVEHSEYPHGLVLKHKKGWKIVYSGDTMPSQDLIEAGHNCNLLIHEATFDADQVDEAREKQHSTCDQAIEVGRSMKAKFIMLTHFSRKYEKLPLFSKKFSDNVGVAVDMMRVKLSDLPQLPSFVEAYNVIYEAEYLKMQQNIANKQHRLELAKSLL